MAQSNFNQLAILKLKAHYVLRNAIRIVMDHECLIKIFSDIVGVTRTPSRMEKRMKSSGVNPLLPIALSEL